MFFKLWRNKLAFYREAFSHQSPPRRSARTWSKTPVNSPLTIRKTLQSKCSLNFPYLELRQTHLEFRTSKKFLSLQTIPLSSLFQILITSNKHVERKGKTPQPRREAARRRPGRNGSLHPCCGQGKRGKTKIKGEGTGLEHQGDQGHRRPDWSNGFPRGKLLTNIQLLF